MTLHKKTSSKGEIKKLAYYIYNAIYQIDAHNLPLSGENYYCIDNHPNRLNDNIGTFKIFHRIHGVWTITYTRKGILGIPHCIDTPIVAWNAIVHFEPQRAFYAIYTTGVGDIIHDPIPYNSIEAALQPYVNQSKHAVHVYDWLGVAAVYDPLVNEVFLQEEWRSIKIITVKAEMSKNAIEPLSAGLKRLKAEPQRFKEFNPANGWGTYDGLVEFVGEYLEACKNSPTAIVTASR